MTDFEAMRREIADAESALQEKRIRLAVLSHEGFGQTGIRDPDNICTAFVEGKPSMHGGDCDTDGHYLCDECERRKTCEGGCGYRPTGCECKDGPNAGRW